MKRLISTLNLSKEDWLRYRKCGITGTDAGAYSWSKSLPLGISGVPR